MVFCLKNILECHSDFYFDPVSETKDTLVRKVRSRGKSKNLYATYEPHIDNAGIP